MDWVVENLCVDGSSNEEISCGELFSNKEFSLGASCVDESEECWKSLVEPFVKQTWLSFLWREHRLAEMAIDRFISFHEHVNFISCLCISWIEAELCSEESHKRKRLSHSGSISEFDKWHVSSWCGCLKCCPFGTDLDVLPISIGCREELSKWFTSSVAWEVVQFIVWPNFLNWTSI